MDAAALVVPIQGRLDQFQRDLNQAGDMADQKVAEIESSFRNMNPSAGGLIAAAGGLVTAWGLDKALDIVKALNHAMADLAETSRSVGMTVEQFQQVKFAFNVGGASDQDVTTSMGKMAQLLNDASRDENSLTKLLDANNIKYKDRNGELISTNQLLIIAADLMKKAATPQDELAIAKMLGISSDLVPTLRQGGEALQKLMGDAQAAGAVIDEQTVQKAAAFDKEWRKSSTEWQAYMKAAVVGLLPYIDDLIAKAQAFGKQVVQDAPAALETLGRKAMASGILMKSDVSKSFGGDDLSALSQEELQYIVDLFNKNGQDVDPAVVQRLNEMKGGNGKAPTGFSQAPAFKQSDWIDGYKGLTGDFSSYTNATNVPGKDKSSTDAFDRQANQITKQIELLKSEAGSYGLDAEAKAEDRAQMEMINAAVQAGREPTADLIDKVGALAEAYGKAAKANADAAQKFQANNQLLQFSGNEVVSILDGIRTKSMTVQQAVTNLSNTLITAFEKSLLLGQGPLAYFMGMSPAAGSGGTGGLMGMFAALLPGRASGGPVSPGSLYNVGENGPEIFAPSIPGTIVPNGGGGGGGVVVNVHNAPPGTEVQTNRGAGGTSIDIMVQRAVRNTINADMAAYGPISQGMSRRFGLDPTRGLG